MLPEMSKISDVNEFRVNGESPLSLSDFPNRIDRLYKDKKDYSRKLKGLTGEINELQRMMYANDHHSLLLVFQAMDAAGKDGTIRNVLSGVNPHGVTVHSFKRPSEEEIDHDFLWRSMDCLPHLERNGTRVLKFFLNVSQGEQLDRFIARIDEPDKNWKFNEGDIEERKFWDQYQVAYEEAINATATPSAPWFVIPADDKKNMRLLVAEVIRDEMKALNLSYPEVSDERRAELQAMRKTLVDGGKD